MKARSARSGEQSLWTAWHVAALTRTKKLPRLEAILKPKAQKRAQTPAAMISVMNALVGRTGGTLEGDGK